MIKVAPSILSADYMNLEKDIKLVDQAGAEELHIDVMDGTFVPSISYGPGFVKAIRQITDMYLDVHMMVQNPEHLIPAMAEAGADNIGVHVEATPHIHRALQLIKNAGKDAEVVINPGTPVEMIKPVLHMVDQVLLTLALAVKSSCQKRLPRLLNWMQSRKLTAMTLTLKSMVGSTMKRLLTATRLAPRLRLPVHTSTMPKTHWLAFKHCATLLNNQVN